MVGYFSYINDHTKSQTVKKKLTKKLNYIIKISSNSKTYSVVVKSYRFQLQPLMERIQRTDKLKYGQQCHITIQITLQY